MPAKASTVTALSLFLLITLSQIIPISTDTHNVTGKHDLVCYDCSTTDQSDNCFTMNDPSQIKVRDCGFVESHVCLTEGQDGSDGGARGTISRHCAQHDKSKTDVGCRPNPAHGPGVTLCGCQTPKCNDKPGDKFNT